MTKLLIWTDLLMYYGILVFCATIPFSIALATGGIFGAMFGWLLRCAMGKRLAWNSTPLDKFILLFLAVQFCSIFFSMDRTRSILEARSYWHLFPFLILLQGDFGEKRLSRATRILIAGCVFSAILGIAQCIQYYLHGLYGHEGTMPRITGAFGMYMTYSGILAMIWAVALNLFVQELKTPTGRWPRILYLAALLIIGGALALTLTRTAILAVVAAVLVLLVLKFPRTFIAIALAGVILGISVPALRQAGLSLLWGNQTPTTDTNVMIPQGDQRPYLWKGAYRIIKEHPWTGVGLANFRLAYKKHLPYELPKTYNHAHNNFLHLGAETGLPGLATFVLLSLALLFYLFRWYLRAPEGGNKALIGGALGATVGFQAAGLFEYNFGDSEVALIFWVLIGLAAVASGLGRGKRVAP